MNDNDTVKAALTLIEDTARKLRVRLVMGSITPTQAVQEATNISSAAHRLLLEFGKMEDKAESAAR